MTQQYLIGELSLRLARLGEAAGGTAFERAATRLRREAETQPFDSLSRPLLEALALCDRLCWDSLTHGEISAFQNQVAACADLYDFGMSAGLLSDDTLRWL